MSDVSLITLPLKIVNEDGTSIEDFPKNPLKDRWEKQYQLDKFGRPCSPIAGYQEDGRPYMNYGCVLCCSTQCHHSDCFIIPEEDKQVYEEYKNQIKEYNRIHNPSLEDHIRKCVEATLGGKSNESITGQN